jgi:hypothetical protein
VHVESHLTYVTQPGCEMARQKKKTQMRLAGKSALITATAKGQGRAAAVLFAAEAEKVGCDKKVEEDRETAAMSGPRSPAAAFT